MSRFCGGVNDGSAGCQTSLRQRQPDRDRDRRATLPRALEAALQLGPGRRAASARPHRDVPLSSGVGGAARGPTVHECADVWKGGGRDFKTRPLSGQQVEAWSLALVQTSVSQASCPARSRLDSRPPCG